MDMQTFYLTYRDIPQRVDELLRFVLEKVRELAVAQHEQDMEARVY